jgi:DNA-binding CsgD family transcriptional regulator
MGISEKLADLGRAAFSTVLVDNCNGSPPAPQRAHIEPQQFGPSPGPPTTFIIETPDGEFAVMVYESVPDLSQLTASERQIHQLVMDGCSNDDISRRRNVSKRTVINQLMSIYRKLGVGSRRELKAHFRRPES